MCSVLGKVRKIPHFNSKGFNLCLGHIHCITICRPSWSSVIRNNYFFLFQQVVCHLTIWSKCLLDLRVDVCTLVFKKSSTHIIYHINIQGDFSIVLVNIMLSCILLNPNVSRAYAELKFSPRDCHCCHCYRCVFASVSGNRLYGNIAQFCLIVNSSSLAEKWIFIHKML